MMNNILLNSNYYRTWEKHCRFSKGTISRSRTTLERLGNFISNAGFEGTLDFNQFFYDEVTEQYLQIDQEFLEEFIESLKQNGATKCTLYNTIVELRSFFEFLAVYELIQYNPAGIMKNPYFERKLIDRSLSKEECVLLLEAALEMDPFWKSYYLLILLLIVTGMRNSEVTHLTRSQFDLERGVINVNIWTKSTAKGCYIPRKLVEEFKRYFSHPKWQEWNQAGNQEVFFYMNKKFSRDRLHLILKEIAEKAGIKRNVHPHMLRHTCAHPMNEAGIDPSTIQRQLRQEHLYTTLRYLAPFQDVVDAQEELSNRFDLEDEDDKE